MSTITLVVALMITHNFHIGYDMTSKYTPLIEAAAEIKLETTTAHLRLEEILNAEKQKDIDKVIKNIDNAIWYTNAIIHGGDNHERTFLAIDNKVLEIKPKSILDKLKKFQKFTKLRYENLNDFHADSEILKEYDTVFKELIAEVYTIENELQKTILSELKAYKITYFLTLLALLVFLFIISLLLTRYEKRLQEMSVTDPLTKLYNRLYMENIFEAELQRAKRYQQTFSIIFMDIDHFKLVNDDFGHDVGDIVLVEVANIIKSNIRSTDIMARWGGEEFIILCPETDLQSAKILSEKLRKTVESHAIKPVGHKTCSFGVSQYSTQDDSIKRTIKRADDALYEAKESGRNKVVAK
ncbi:GGDEF domain-containing protein [Sulfurimonas sp.]|uniref:GGDEF domain-containing protein n=1 Tax=Sulfurimonas sp. TaxID=2022749 RepID=UPI00262780C7|nr:GGDEF domain-containing protein [Sulfurimonas sp.]MCW8896265.1 GGDEF domain-containing protein [Sulfurimonas sp.]MCW9068089.1 GGDEF domain-containing protein [Sulfurimonas sp.]